jgi:hypothetical protein
VQQPVAQLPWGHITLMLDKLETRPDLDFYATEAVRNGWSRGLLSRFIHQNLHLIQGSATTNFEVTGPYATAFRTPSQPRTGRGAPNRGASTGGSANGIPRNTARPAYSFPRNALAAVRTSGSPTPVTAFFEGSSGHRGSSRRTGRAATGFTERDTFHRSFVGSGISYPRFIENVLPFTALRGLRHIRSVTALNPASLFEPPCRALSDSVSINSPESKISRRYQL